MSLEDAKANLATGTKLGSCSENCKACQVKHWLWEWDDWSLEFQDRNGKVFASNPMHWDFHTVSGRVGPDGSDPSAVYSKNGMRPVEGPAPPSHWRVKTGDEWTENDPSNRPLYMSMSPEEISNFGLSAGDLYPGSGIAKGMDLKTNADVVSSKLYLKVVVNLKKEVQTCYCMDCK
jgi:hypothetical protein